MKQTTEHTEYTEEENLTEYRRFAAYGISRKETVYGNMIRGKDEESHGTHGKTEKVGSYDNPYDFSSGIMVEIYQKTQAELCYSEIIMQL